MAIELETDRSSLLVKEGKNQIFHVSLWLVVNLYTPYTNKSKISICIIYPHTEANSICRVGRRAKPPREGTME